VDSGVFPLYEVEGGAWKLSRKPKQLKPVTEYFKGQGRYRHLDESLISYIQDRVNQRWERLVEACSANGDR
jgi:pyruvate ferredoxin oxidoreductase beta subunit